MDETVIIGEAYDSFTIVIGDKRWSFNQEDTKEDLVDMFKFLGFEDVIYEEWY